ncbi:MAG: SBBP repeat-containing protein [Anaerolineae bacterium]|nr:SBBP repeat-containing protein [Anaerolineae bacterium]
MFIENVGQFDEGARFQVRGGDRAIWLAGDGLWVTVMEPVTRTLHSPRDAREREAESSLGKERYLEHEDKPRRGVSLKLSFPGANPHASLEPFDRVDTRVSYFTGNDPERWQSDVPVWGGVRYVDLYPGVDLVITGKDGHWTWRLACENRGGCESTLRRIGLRVDGADALTLETLRGEGRHVRLATTVGDFSLPLLQIVNADGTLIEPTADRPEVRGSEIVAPFDSPVPVVKGLRKELSPSALNAVQGSGDPPGSGSSDLLYSTYVGGSSDEDVGGIALDQQGNVYVAGTTHSTNFPTTPGAFTTTYSSSGDVFVFKLAPASNGNDDLLYATYLGGEHSDRAYDIVVDDAGNVYVTGETQSQ